MEIQTHRRCNSKVENGGGQNVGKNHLKKPSNVCLEDLQIEDHTSPNSINSVKLRFKKLSSATQADKN